MQSDLANLTEVGSSVNATEIFPLSVFLPDLSQRKYYFR